MRIDPYLPGGLAVSISFDLPAAVEDQLRRELADLDVAAKEAALVELYRQGRIETPYSFRTAGSAG